MADHDPVKFAMLAFVMGVVVLAYQPQARGVQAPPPPQLPESLASRHLSYITPLAPVFTLSAPMRTKSTALRLLSSGRKDIQSPSMASAR